MKCLGEVFRVEIIGSCQVIPLEFSAVGGARCWGFTFSCRVDSVFLDGLHIIYEALMHACVFGWV